MTISSGRIILGLAVLLTAASGIAWAVTGRHYYTKYTVVEEVDSQVDADDPLAETGFYDGETRTETVRRDEFHFGLLPTPQGILDKHAISVLSICGPVWLFALGMNWWSRRRRTSAATAAA